MHSLLGLNGLLNQFYSPDFSDSKPIEFQIFHMTYSSSSSTVIYYGSYEVSLIHLRLPILIFMVIITKLICPVVI